ncbi:MAG: DUF1080 domain-containing protein [Thermoguttaceae bacterium]|nr:DUF1080 domain-containing protein [Thermoguttaceae bacterium]MBQ6828016.1 DUF1080 domain-containing protein [Thermoguttaceae bacterium]
MRLRFGRGAALRVALGTAVAMCATSAAEAKIFNGDFCRAWREARQQRAQAFCDWRASETNDAPPSEATIVPAPAGSGNAAFYVVDGIKTPLFNGVDLSGWTSVDGGAPGEGWKVVDGTIFREKNAGDLYFDGKFENFVLEFEFKISEKGNSGVKYRSWNTSGYGLGCEYQIYDDINDAKNPPRYQTASLYDVVAPREGTAKIKMGEFNRGKIVVLGNRIEHYLNDELIVSINVGSPEWNELVGKSKFKDMKEFGTTAIGRIFLQDHNCQVWFKNIYVTKMKPAYPVGCLGLFYRY